MSSEKMFFTLTSLYTVVQIMMHFMPEAIAAIGEMVVAMNRIEVSLDIFNSVAQCNKWNLKHVFWNQECLLLKEKESNELETPLLDEGIPPSIKVSSFSAK
jgi:hypothetical protein